jgi:hypothetical protein
MDEEEDVDEPSGWDEEKISDEDKNATANEIIDDVLSEGDVVTELKGEGEGKEKKAVEKDTVAQDGEEERDVLEEYDMAEELQRQRMSVLEKEHDLRLLVIKAVRLRQSLNRADVYYGHLPPIETLGEVYARFTGRTRHHYMRLPFAERELWVSRVRPIMEHVVARLEACISPCARCRAFYIEPNGWMQCAILCGAPEPRSLHRHAALVHDTTCLVRAALEAQSHRQLGSLGLLDESVHERRAQIVRYLADAPLPPPKAPLYTFTESIYRFIESQRDAFDCLLLPKPATTDTTRYTTDVANGFSRATESSIVCNDPKTEVDGREADMDEENTQGDDSRRGIDMSLKSGAYAILQVMHEEEPLDTYRPWHQATRLWETANERATTRGEYPTPCPVYRTVREALQHAIADDLMSNRWISTIVSNVVFSDPSGSTSQTRTVAYRSRATAPGLRPLFPSPPLKKIVNPRKPIRPKLPEHEIPQTASHLSAPSLSSSPFYSTSLSSSTSSSSSAFSSSVSSSSASSSSSTFSSSASSSSSTPSSSSTSSSSTSIENSKPGLGIITSKTGDKVKPKYASVAAASARDGKRRRCESYGQRKKSKRQGEIKHARNGVKDARGVASSLDSSVDPNAVMYETKDNGGGGGGDGSDVDKSVRKGMMQLEMKGDRHLASNIATGDTEDKRATVCFSDVARFWPRSNLEVVAELNPCDHNTVRARCNRTAIGASIHSPTANTECVHATFSCARGRNVYCIVDVTALDPTYTSRRQVFCEQVIVHLLANGHIIRSLSDIVISYLPGWIPVAFATNAVNPEFSVDALDELHRQ